MKKQTRKRVTIIGLLVLALTLGAVRLFAAHAQSENEIIGQNDGLTDIWVTDETK